MKDEIRSKLDAAFERHEASRRAVTEAREVKETKEQVFSRSFSELRDSLIRPAMEEIGQYVKGKGYSYEISTEDEHVATDSRSRSTSASIKITLFLDERKHPEYEMPFLSVIAQKERQNVRFHESTMVPGRGGASGPAGETSLAEITPQLIQEKILKVVSDVFR
jgi:hypothetical protein